MQDDDFRALQEQAHMLNELTRHAGWAVLVDYLQATSASMQRRLLNGHISSHEEYKQVSGELVGITKALRAPDQVAQMVRDEVERRAQAGLPVT